MAFATTGGTTVHHGSRTRRAFRSCCHRLPPNGGWYGARGVGGGYRAMADREALKILIRPWFYGRDRSSHMTSWSQDDLDRIGRAQELQIASTRPDGSLRPYVTIWVVRAGDELYVRSAYGSTNPWFVRARAAGTGRVRAGGIERDVTFTDAAPGVHAAIDAAYHAKYDRYGPQIVGSVIGDHVRDVTVRLQPRGN